MKIEENAIEEGQSILLNYTLKNHGLVKALNVSLYLPQSNEEWSMTALAETGPFTLAAQDSIVIPVLLHKKVSAATSRNKSMQSTAESGAMTFSRCMASMAYEYEWICGDELKNNTVVENVAINTCVAGSIFAALAEVVTSLGLDKFGFVPHGSSGGSPSPPNDDKENSYGNTSKEAYIDADKYLSFCNPDDAKCAKAIIDGSTGFSVS